MNTHLRLATKEQEQPQQRAETGTYTHHMWIAASPFFEPVLSVSPLREEQFVSRLSFFDADGVLFNECALTCPGSRGVELELKPFLESCKFDGGWKHGHLQVSSSHQARYTCRVSDGVRTSIYQPAPLQKLTVAHALPVKCQATRKNMIALVSGEPEEITVRLRLFVGKRKPDRDIVLAPFATRVVCIEDLFSEFCSDEEGAEMQSYLKVSALSAPVVSVCHIQVNETIGQKESFSIGALL